MSLHVSSTCAHRQEVKIVLYSLWIITPIGGRPVHRLREEWCYTMKIHILRCAVSKISKLR